MNYDKEMNKLADILVKHQLKHHDIKVKRSFAQISSKRLMTRNRRTNTKMLTKHDLQTFSRIAYVADNSYYVNQIDQTKWEVIHVIQIPESDGVGFVVVCRSTKEIVVAIRGTYIYSWKNIITDLYFIKTPYFLSPGSNVHKGFMKHFESMKAELDIGVDKAMAKYPTGIVISTGHSLGGAVATLFANHFVNRIPAQKGTFKLFTFGSPRVGDAHFATFTNTLIGIDHIYRATFGFDPVAYVPLMLQGYHHVGTQYNFQSPNEFINKGTDDEDSYNPLNLWYVGNHSKYNQITSEASRRRHFVQIYLKKLRKAKGMRKMRRYRR